MTSTTEVVTSSDRLTGRVKWFNNKAGYGFITATDSERAGSDIFVHHSGINVENQQQYKYLIQGEYVEFGLFKTEGGKHEVQASNVSGIKGGKLMCETRNESRGVRSEYKSTSGSTRGPPAGEDMSIAEPKLPRQRTHRDTTQTPAPRARGEGPRDGDKKEWTLVANGASKKPRGRPPKQSTSSLEAK
jgi:CspA family cold shock protein